jgi:sRNA-binding protein
MALQIHGMAWNRNSNVAELSRLMGSQRQYINKYTKNKKATVLTIVNHHVHVHENNCHKRFVQHVHLRSVFSYH